MSIGAFGDKIAVSVVDRLFPPERVYAHCDIPCGLYDPHEAQLAALTVLRMDQLIGELPKGAQGPEAAAAEAKLARYMVVKEAHAERVKHELRVIWGDYFTPDHAKQYPKLHELFWQAMKLASKARQGTDLKDAQALVDQVNEIAEIFWKTKGATPKKVPSLQKSGGEIVLPLPA